MECRALRENLVSGGVYVRFGVMTRIYLSLFFKNPATRRLLLDFLLPRAGGNGTVSA